MRIAFKWLSNVLISDRFTFKEIYFTHFDQGKYESFKELIRQRIVSLLFQDLLSYVNKKASLYIAPLAHYTFINQSDIIEKYWKQILSTDLQLTNVSVSCEEANSCYDCLLKKIFSPVWNQSTLDSIASTISECIKNGSTIDRNKLSLFSLIYELGDRPSDFAIANLHDYWGSWFTLASYITSLITYPILVFMDDYIKHINEDCSISWTQFAKQLIVSKTTTNLYDETYVAKYAFIKWIFKQRWKHLNYYFDDLLQDKQWNHAYVIKVAYSKLIQKLVDNIISTNEDLQTVVESFDFNGQINSLINTIKPEVEYKLKRFDKAQIQSYFDQIQSKSSESNHIHPALYPILEFVCQSQDIQSKDHICLTYNALNAIQKLSNFSAVDIDEFVDETFEKHFECYKLNEWANYLKQDCIDYINTQLNQDVLSLQKEEWFYETYVITYRIVTDCLNSGYEVLLGPLFAELRDKYDFAALEDFQQTVNAQVYVKLLDQTTASLQKIIEIFYEEREKLSLNDELDDFIEGNSYNLTRSLQTMISNVLQRYKEFVDLDKAKYAIKETIVQQLYNFAGSTQLRFDVLAGNLDFLLNYDMYYGQFEKAFQNKLFYELRKFYHNIEHSFIGTFYKKVCEIDTYSYLIYPLVDFSTEFKQLEFILASIIFLDVVRYKAINVMEFPLPLQTDFQITNICLNNMMEDETYRNLICTAIES